MLFADKSHMYQVLRDLKDEGLITERPMRAVGPNRRQRTVDVITVTRAGLFYIKDHGLLPWASCLKIPSRVVSISKSSVTVKSSLRLTSISDSAFLCDLAGARIALPVHLSKQEAEEGPGASPSQPSFDDGDIFLGEYDDDLATELDSGEDGKENELPSENSPSRNRGKATSFSQLILSAQAEYVRQREGEGQEIKGPPKETNSPSALLPQGRDIELMFVDVNRLKMLCVGEGDQLDYRRCRLTGLLESHSASLLIYSPMEPTFSWSPWAFKQDNSLATIWRSRGYGIYTASAADLTAGMSGAVFVANPKHMRQVFCPGSAVSGGKQKSKAAGPKEQAEISDSSFAHVYAIPKSQMGIRHLRWLMTGDVEGHLRETVRELIESGPYEEHRIGLDEIISLEHKHSDGHSTYICVCADMDVKRLMRAKEYVKTFKGSELGIACYEWQLSYLQEVAGKDVTVLGLVDPPY